MALFATYRASTAYHFWALVCPKLGPFCTFLNLHFLFMPCQVQFLYCFICTTIVWISLWIYSVPIGKLTSKLKILYFWRPFCLKFGTFCNLQILYNLSFLTSILPKIRSFLHLFEPPFPFYALQSAVLVLFHLHNHFFSPFVVL